LALQLPFNRTTYGHKALIDYGFNLQRIFQVGYCDLQFLHHESNLLELSPCARAIPDQKSA
jgi:hypothetical protein